MHFRVLAVLAEGLQLAGTLHVLGLDDCQVLIDQVPFVDQEGSS